MIRNKNILRGPTNVFVPARTNFGEILIEKLWEFRDNVCLINGATDERITYGEILQQAMNVAISLSHMGVRKGQTVALCSENRVEFLPAAIGAIFAGAIVTTANVAYTPGELKHVFGISKPTTIFCSPFSYKAHSKTLKTLPYLKKVILFGEPIRGTIAYNTLAMPSSNANSNELFNVKTNTLLRNVRYEEFEVVDVKGPMDTLFILYSSGTTGLPKGVMLSHLNILTCCALPASSDPKVLSMTVIPWYHVFGLCGSFTGMVTGRTAVFLPKFDVELFMKTIEKYKVYVITVVPPIVVAVCKSPLQYDLSSVRLILCGAAPLHKDTIQDIKFKFPNAIAMQGYGMTEITLGVTKDTYEVAHLHQIGSVGHVVPGSVIKIADIETGKALGPNQRGEIRAKGPLIMKGYVNKDSSEEFDEEGFFKTGDVGYYDDGGSVFVVDRLKELIKYKGYQVPPAELEAVLLQHEGVKDVGVVGKDSKEAGEVPVAFVVVQPGATVTEEDLKKFVAERLSNPKHLRGGVRFVEQIPKNPSGKILRKELRAIVRREKSKL
ncbi:uncharacterized protein LOC126378403 [Pectinophora gossypiella]|uniref:uncharacterized protein LOC126378403 n=1 Tax=Pectinophora gossypiella TaxID=13191 RepID=UPI00214E77DE|nr:uncharacterized protein LOC126378403 [Pectinophora gossypiella]